MYLYEILDTFDENKDLYVEDKWGDILATYDGRNSIPDTFDWLNVIAITIRDDSFVLTVE